MRKIGIMSMQRIYNYGSFLQAYALMKLIEEVDQNNEVFFVDYTPGEPLVVDEKIEPEGLFRVLYKLREYNNVDTKLINKFKFFNHKRTYAKRFYPLLKITEEKRDTSGLDILVIGSDEVFNCVQSNRNVGYSPELFGYNSKAKATVSYAASFGNTTLEKLEKYNLKDELKDYFAKFKYLSVRDQNSFNILSELGFSNVEKNVDPVLAYDFMKLESRIPSERLLKKKYMIVYGYSGRLSHNENEVIRSYAKSRNLQILCFGGVQECCDKFIDCDPFELLGYIRDAECIITDTFHGTIFSIINKKSFGTIIRKSIDNGYGNEEKLGYLLNLFGLGNQRIDDWNKENLQQVLSQEIDYDNVFDILESKRKETKKYLKKATT